MKKFFTKKIIINNENFDFYKFLLPLPDYYLWKQKSVGYIDKIDNKLFFVSGDGTIFYFKNVDTNPGPKGPRGNRGNKGPEGLPEACQTCGTQENTVGHDYLKDKKKNLIIIEKPLLPPAAFKASPWDSVYGKRVKIYTKNGGKVCGLQWNKVFL